MNLINRLISSFAVIALLSGATLFAQSKDLCDARVLPPNASALIAKKLPGWRIKTVPDLIGYDRELWIKAHPRECPGLAIGHFEALGQRAYGLLLVPRSGSDASYKIIVLSKSALTDEYSMRVLDHDAGKPGASASLVISRVPPGTYPDFEGTRSIHLKIDGLQAEWLEAASVLYYWSGYTYQTIQTSD